MTTATSRRQPELTRQIVVVIGGDADIGLQAARGTAPGSWHSPARLQRRPPEAGHS